MNQENGTILQLPFSVIGKVDVGRLLRELNVLDNFLQAAAVREPGTALKLPKTSRIMDEILQINKLNALVSEDRDRLQKFLESVHDEAPMLHMSFSADPSPRFANQLITWLRQEIHPLVLLQVGLQPGIGAGTVVRTTNKYFDFSLRERFFKNRASLIQKLRNAATQKTKPVTANASAQNLEKSDKPTPPVNTTTETQPPATAAPAPASTPAPEPVATTAPAPAAPSSQSAPTEEVRIDIQGTDDGS